MEDMNALQIAVYAVNCPNDDERIDEVCKLIEDYAKRMNRDLLLLLEIEREANKDKSPF